MPVLNLDYCEYKVIVRTRKFIRDKVEYRYSAIDILKGGRQYGDKTK